MDDRRIAETLFQLLDARRAGATVCPSDVARALGTAHDVPWRPLMPAVRRVAASLARDGRVHVTRGGATVDAEALGGPIRIGRRD